jgi:hypothetical protein
VWIGPAQACRRVTHERIWATAAASGVDNARTTGTAAAVGVADLTGWAAAAAGGIADALTACTVAQVAVADLARSCTAAIAARIADARAGVDVALLTRSTAAAAGGVCGAQTRGCIADFASNGPTGAGAAVGISLPLAAAAVVASGDGGR